MALAATLVAAGLVLPPLAAGLVAPPAYASSTFLVTNTKDTGAGSLRQAILDANNTGADAINFAIPQDLRDPTTGIATIKPQSALPTITEQVTINGYSQADAHANTKAVGDDASLKVQLDGTNVSGVGLEIQGAPNSVIKGLVINRFGSSGIDASGAPSVGLRIEGNFIGTDPTGTLDKGNDGPGVSLFTHDISQTVVGGTTPAARNVVSGNARTGIDLGDTSFDNVAAESVRVSGNYVGTDKSGTKDLGNDGEGVFLEIASASTIGGKTAASRNVVSGNGQIGVDMDFVSASQVLGNRIGTTANGTGDLGNDGEGVDLVSSPSELGDGTSAGSNTVAFNGGDGVTVFSGNGSEISHNSVFSNAGLGIDLLGSGEGPTTNVSTANDPLDADTGPNGLQNKPVLSSARTGSLKTTIKGTLNTKPNLTYTVEFYANPANTNEGKKFVGETTFKTSVDGLHAFTFSPSAKVSAGQTITATTTNVTDGSPHDTSEFSAPRTVTSV